MREFPSLFCISLLRSLSSLRAHFLFKSTKKWQINEKHLNAFYCKFWNLFAWIQFEMNGWMKRKHLMKIDFRFDFFICSCWISSKLNRNGRRLGWLQRLASANENKATMNKKKFRIVRIVFHFQSILVCYLTIMMNTVEWWRWSHWFRLPKYKKCLTTISLVGTIFVSIEIIVFHVALFLSFAHFLFADDEIKSIVRLIGTKVHKNNGRLKATFELGKMRSERASDQERKRNEEIKSTRELVIRLFAMKIIIVVSTGKRNCTQIIISSKTVRVRFRSLDFFVGFYLFSHFRCFYLFLFSNRFHLIAYRNSTIFWWTFFGLPEFNASFHWDSPFFCSFAFVDACLVDCVFVWVCKRAWMCQFYFSWLFIICLCIRYERQWNWYPRILLFVK